MKIFIYVFSISMTLVHSKNLLYVDDGKIKNHKEQTIYMKGCNLGNWLMLEMWMLDYAGRGIADQYEFLKTLSDRFGEQEANLLMDTYRNNWIKEKDFDIIKSFGMNTIRLPFDYKLLMHPDKMPFQLRDDAWEWIDWTIEMARKRGMYVILDMHGAPGRQSGMDHSGRVGYNKLWSNKKYQDQTVWLWDQISMRYKDNATVAAYDIMNEPWGSNENNLKKIVLKCYKSIRKNKDNHIIIFPGHTSGIDFYKNIRSVNLKNIIYTMHFYPGFFGWGTPKPYVHAEFLLEGLKFWEEKMKSFDNAPLLIGEFNVVLKDAGGGEMMRRYFDYYESLGWPATMWSYKVLNSNGGIGEGSWGMITNKNKLSSPDIRSVTKKEIFKWFSNLGNLEHIIDEDLKFWLTTNKPTSSLDSIPKRPPKLLLPESNDALPENWHARDIGKPLRGGQRLENNRWTIYGGGNDIWNESDQFRFVHTKLEGDFNFSVKVDSLKDTHHYAKAGIMIRKNLRKNSSHGILNLFPSGNSEFGYREKDGATMRAESGPQLDFSTSILRAERLNNEVYFYVKNGSQWDKVGRIDVKGWGKSIYVGLATLSHDNNQLTAAVYSDIEIKQRK